MSRALAAAALALVGRPWRLHGRDPATGLDCIGLLDAALIAIGQPARLPTGYPLRLRDWTSWLPDPAKFGFAVAATPVQPGDVVLLKLGQTQVHLAIAAPTGGWVHAHAGLRRVVRQDQWPDGEVVGHWRLLT